MAQTDEHVATLPTRPIAERAKAARMLLDGLDEDDGDADVEEAQVAELVRRMSALDDATAGLIDGADGRARAAARLRAIRARSLASSL